MTGSRRGPAVFAVLASLALGLSAFAAAAQGAADSAADKPKLVDLWLPGDAGTRMNIRGRVTALDGTPIAGASIFIRQADGNGEYTERYSTTIESDHKGRYQFASVVPGQYYGVKHVHLWITHDAYRALDTEILFKGDPNLHDENAPNAIFLEEATVNGETVMYGRFDIMLAPQ